MTTPRHVVRQATVADAEAITRILATGFHDDPPLKWILPDADERQLRSPRFFQPFVDLVLADGQAFITEDLAGAALWLHVDVTAPSDDDGGELHEILSAGIGAEAAKRFQVLDELFTAHHPSHESHDYLLFVGTTPDRQCQGVGTALLSHRLADLDARAMPAYLEASSPRNAALYGRLGFRPTGDGVTLPDGPTLHPMWRPAGTGVPVPLA